MRKLEKFETYLADKKKALISGPFGSNISSKYFVEKGVPVIRGNNLSFNAGKFVDEGFVFITEEKAMELNCFAEPDDLVFTAAGTIGQVGLITSDLKFQRYTISNKQIRATVDKNKLDVKFAYYAISSEKVKAQIIAGNTGSTIPLINLSTIRNLLIPSFSLKEQQAIAEVLSSLDDKIELNNRINVELEKLAKLLYDYWFVQYDFPNAEGKPYRSSGGKMVYNETLKRDIPEGWEVKRLEEIEANIITGKTPPTSNADYFGGDIPFVTIDDIRKQLYVLTAERTLSKIGADTQPSKYLYPGDICVSCIGTIGVIGIIGTLAQSNQQINTLSQLQPHNRFFLLNALRRHFELNDSAKKGAILANMNKGDFSQIPIIDSTTDLKQQYTERVSVLYEKIKNNLQQNAALASLRDWLLPLLMNGQVVVGAAEEEGFGAPVMRMAAEADVPYGASSSSA